MDAFFYIDKPTGVTSFDVLRDMRRILNIKKIGHTGTLDPLATGGLLVATGNYTKLIPYVEKDSKSYLANIMLDGVSPSYDSDTEIDLLSEKKQENFRKKISKDQLNNILSKNFLGKITQVPPKYSALKINGKRALDRTLAGEDIQMKERETEIFSYNIISYSYPKLIIEIKVSAGTYIRSIANDIWEILGTGGYLSALRRTSVWALDIDKSTPLNDLDISKTLDIQGLFLGKCVIFQDEWIYKRLSDGQRVRWDFDFPEYTDIFLFDGDMVRYVVEYKEGVIHPRKKVV